MATNENQKPALAGAGLVIPKMPQRRPSKEEKQQYATDMQSFATRIQGLQARIPRKVSSRGWCYLLEGMGVVTKGQFNLVEKAINDCRKEGLLPLDFVEADESRRFHHREAMTINTESPEEYLERKLRYLLASDADKDDVTFWQQQKYYIEMLVEKKDLLNLFQDTCAKYHIAIANSKGWSDLISRGELALRFKEAEQIGLQPVLLYFGDFDVGGLLIAQQLRDNIADIQKATGYDPKNLIIDHFGLGYDFIQKHGLTWIDNLESGSGKVPDKSKKHVAEYIAKYGERKCEANAVLVREREVLELLEDTIRKYLPDPFASYDKAIQETRERVRLVMDELGMKDSIKQWLARLATMTGKEIPNE